MQFKDLDIRRFYDSGRNDVYNEFFNVVLSNSNYYKRYGGLFSAKRFALVAEGLQHFIKENNGTMELAIIPVFSEEDKNALLRGVSVDDLITKNWINDLSKIKEKFLEDHKKALSWMIANGYLTIRLILPMRPDGTYFTESELMEKAILRREVGIFYNRDDQSPISFHGIIDRENSDDGERYAIDVSRSWVGSEVEEIENDFQEFSSYWDSDVRSKGQIVFQIKPLTSDLESYFKQIAPKSKSEVPTLRKPPVLRKYQEDAVDAWEKNNGRGIFEMATGTGKTFTAIGCIKRIENKEKTALVIIAAPYRNLIDQWRGELSKWFIESTLLEQGSWRQIIRDEVYQLNRTNEKKLSVLITSHALFAEEEFVKQIERCKIPTMLVVDEAHHVGSYASRNGLSKNYQYRLALSATIDRYYDDDGTDFLRNYFTGSTGDSTIARYTLEQAIKDKKLCGYYYYPFFVDLNDEEKAEYRRMTYQAAKLLNSKNFEDKKRGEEVIMKRSKIIRDAENKIDSFRQIIREIKKLKHMLVFCSENQFDVVSETLNNLARYCGIDKSLLFRKITYENPPDKKDRFKILSDFADEEWDALLSNKVLDEGMDIPQAQTCIVLASSGNSTQFIQRRGRVLRIFDGVYKDGSKKEFANIYDILVRPQINDLEDPDAIKLEIGMIRSQLSRISDMSKLAINQDYCIEKIKEFTYGLSL
jgi:superfamily II DNA or RNA helicase